MKNSTSNFFILFSESLIIFMIFGILTADKETSTLLLAFLSLSFLLAYSAIILYPKLISIYGDKYYRLIFIIQHTFLSTILYSSRNIIGYTTSYTNFIINYILLCIVTYYLNKKFFMKEIFYLNNIIKNSKHKK